MYLKDLAPPGTIESRLKGSRASLPDHSWTYCARTGFIDGAYITAVKGPRQYGSGCIYRARVAPHGLVRKHKEQISVYRPCIS